MVFGRKNNRPIIGATIALFLLSTGCTTKASPEAQYCVKYSVESPYYDGSETKKTLLVTVPALGRYATGYVVGFRAPEQPSWADSEPITAASRITSSVLALAIKSGDVQFRIGEVYDENNMPANAAPDDKASQITFSASNTEELSGWDNVSGTSIQPQWAKDWHEIPVCSSD